MARIEERFGREEKIEERTLTQLIYMANVSAQVRQGRSCYLCFSSQVHSHSWIVFQSRGSRRIMPESYRQKTHCELLGCSNGKDQHKQEQRPPRGSWSYCASAPQIRPQRNRPSSDPFRRSTSLLHRFIDLDHCLTRLMIRQHRRYYGQRSEISQDLGNQEVPFGAP